MVFCIRRLRPIKVDKKRLHDRSAARDARQRLHAAHSHEAPSTSTKRGRSVLATAAQKRGSTTLQTAAQLGSLSELLDARSASLQ